MKNKKFALIGKPLGHSYSALLHERFGLDYSLVETEPSGLGGLLRGGEYDGFNVTYPYKKDVIPFLDQTCGAARELGVVNTVCRDGDRLLGYNTDAAGAEYLFRSNGIDAAGKKALILGTGSTAGSVARALRGANVVFVGRSSPVNYQNCYEHTDASVIVNTTPVGMFPDARPSLLDIERFAPEAVVDVIYNPRRTDLLVRAKEMGVKAVDGLGMLVAQAVGSARLFGADLPEGDAFIDEQLAYLAVRTSPVVFVGMPGSGKTTLTRMAARLLGREFIDTDDAVQSLAGRTAAEIITEDGEAAFRNLEKQALARAMATDAVVATGGGVVEDAENRRAMLSRGFVIYVCRPLENLAREGRPLSSSPAAVEAIYNRRSALYERTADAVIDNSGTLKEAERQLEKLLR